MTGGPKKRSKGIAPVLFSILLGFCLNNVQVAAAETLALQDGTLLEGEFTQGGLLLGTTKMGANILLDGMPVRVSDSGKFLLGFGRDDKLTWKLDIRYPDGSNFEHKFMISKRNYDVQHIDGLEQSKVTPPAEVYERIIDDIELVKNARRTDHDRTDFLEPMDWPLIGIITGVYGSQRVLNGQPRRPHYGIDIFAPADSPVVAPTAGIVTLAHDDMYFTGGTLIIDHGHGLSSTFSHLKSIVVTIGERVEKGQIIATVGSTGRSTGPHLDWRLNLYATRLDPQLVVGEMPLSK